MKFEELKNSFKSGIKNAYLILGVDEYLLTLSYSLILKYSNVQFKDLNVIEFKEGIIDCEDVVRALNTMPVFSDKKIVYVDLRMAKKLEFKNAKVLNEYLKNPNKLSVLAVNIGSNDEDFGLEKSLFETVDCSRLDQKFVKAKVDASLKSHSKSISASAFNLLMQYTLGDLSKILVETEKLVSFVGDRAEIIEDDVRAIVNRSIEYQIFELTEALSRKNSTKVYEILNDLKSKKDEYKTLPSLIYAHFRRLLHIALNPNVSNLELSKMLGVKEYAVKMSQAQAKSFSKSSLKKINDLCIKLDYDLKQSNITLDNAIELMVLTILNLN